MGKALDSSAALDFIKKGPSKPEEVDAPVSQAPEASTDVEDAPVIPPKAKPKAKPAPSKAEEKPKKEKAAPPKEERLVVMNTRIPESLSRDLFRASMERKLDKIEPYTQQDIVAEALRAWLKKNKV